MKTASRWILSLFVALLAALAAIFAALLVWLVPVYADLALRDSIGPNYRVTASRIQWPDTLGIDGIHLNGGKEGPTAGIQRARMQSGQPHGLCILKV